MTDASHTRATQWAHSYGAAADRDLLYQAQIGNLDVVNRSRLYTQALRDEDRWAPHHDDSLGWVVRHLANLHLAFAEDTDGRWRPIRCDSEQQAERVAQQFNDLERRSRNIAAFHKAPRAE